MEPYILNARSLGEETEDDLRWRTFSADERKGIASLRGILPDRGREARLAHAGPAADYSEITTREASIGVLELSEPGRDANYAALALVSFLDVFERCGQEFADVERLKMAALKF